MRIHHYRKHEVKDTEPLQKSAALGYRILRRTRVSTVRASRVLRKGISRYIAHCICARIIYGVRDLLFHRRICIDRRSHIASDIRSVQCLPKLAGPAIRDFLLPVRQERPAF